MLADVTMSAVAQIRLAEIIQQDATSAHISLSIFLHPPQPFHVYLALTAFLRKLVQLYNIGNIIEKQRIRGKSVTASTSNLLIEILYAFRQVIVNDKTHITLVYPHSEGNGGTYNLHPVTDKILLRLFAFLHTQPSMINRSSKVMTAQIGRHALCSFTAQTIYYTAIVLMTQHELQDGLVPFLRIHSSSHIQVQIGTVERGDKHTRLWNVQLLQNVCPSHLVRRCRQCHDGHAGEHFLQDT